MSGAGLFLLFLAILLVAARLCLRGDQRPSIPPDDDPTTGFRDPSRPAERPDRHAD
ncbi:hypothetical protein [uncultured Sphingomonas sp.]|uniref:hypothetical protein n=1 Tax=uncultured Sphingomonas sp. TaxID=158754 RepID=UPI0035C98A82